MKQTKKLTYEQKKLLTKKGLDSTKYRLVSEDALQIEVVNTETNEIIRIEKGGKTSEKG